MCAIDAPADPEADAVVDDALNIDSFDEAAAVQTDLYRRLLPWTGGRALYNFSGRPDGRATDARTAFDEAGFARLQAVKATWDPENMFRFNVNIPPAPAAPPTRKP